MSEPQALAEALAAMLQAAARAESGPLAVSVEEAAALVGVSERLVKTLIARHQFPCVRLGERVVIPVDALRTWLVERALSSIVEEAEFRSRSA